MEILILSILILINGFFALSEIALVSSKRSRLEQFKKDKPFGSKITLKLLDDSENFLSAIQVGITLIGIITGVYGGINIADDFAPFFEKYEIFKDSSHEIALSITVIIITYFSIVIGELVPKTIALSNPEKIAVRIAGPIYFFSIMFYPIVRFLSFSTSLINSLLRIKKRPDTFTESELRHILKSASREGVIEKEQNLIHEKVFYFSDKKARHIMTHRMEVEWIDINQPLSVIKEKILKSDHSKLICCENNLDNFIGILNIKDFLVSLALSDQINVADKLTQPLIIPDNADAHKVLSLFKEKNTHFSIVVNEYGTFEGIITLHDILENLIGDIPEEGEVAEPDIFIRDDQSFLVSGDAPVEVLDGIIDNYMTDFDHIDFSTVAGFVLNHIDKLPQIGDKFTFNDYIIEIVDIDGMRIDKILIRKK
jgi:putative hemolysin